MKIKCPCCDNYIALSVMASQVATEPLTVSDVAEIVSAATGVSVEKMKHKSRERKCVVARQKAIWIARHYTGETLLNIGKFFNRHHTSVMNSVETIDNLMEVYPEWRYQMQILCEQLRKQYKKAV